MTNYDYIKRVANMETINHISKKDLQGLLRELVDWIESQDLIRRDDLDDVIETEYRCSNCNNHANEDCEWCVANSFKQIPKAEPPKE